MTEFDRTKRDFTERVAKAQIQRPKVGIVSEVFEHTVSDDDSNFEVDVEVYGNSDREDEETDTGVATLRRVPVHSPASGSIVPPKVGDKIIVIYTAGRSSSPVAYGTGWSSTDRPPLGKSGMYRNRFKSDKSPLGRGDLHITGYTFYDDNPAVNDKRELSPQESLIQIAKHEEGDNVDPINTPNTLPAKIEMYDSPLNDAAEIVLEGTQVDGNPDKSLTSLLDFKDGIASTESLEEINDDPKKKTKVEHDIKDYTLTDEGLDIDNNKETRIEHDITTHTLMEEGLDIDANKETRVEHDVDNHTITVEGSGSSDTYTIEIDVDSDTATIKHNNSETGAKFNFSSGVFKLLDGDGHGIESDGSGNFTWHYKSINYNQGSTTTL